MAVLLEAVNSGPALLALADPRLLPVPYFSWTPRVDDGLAGLLLGLWVATALLFMIGWHARTTGTVLALTLGSVLLLDQQLYSNHLYLMVLVTGLLALADCGAANSLDARRSGMRETIAGWPVWLLKLQVTGVYAFAAISKLNPAFLSGSVIASNLRREGLLAVPDGWRTFEPMFVLALLAVSAEAFLAVGLWSKRWRPIAFVVGLGLHLSIAAWLSPPYALLVFSALSLPLYIVFLDAAPDSRIVVWDDGCGFCETWVRWFRRLDWLNVLRFVPRSQLASAALPVTETQAAAAVQLVTGVRVHSGFAAVGRVAEILPISFLWAPLLRLAPIAYVGGRVYRRVAARRLCAIGEPRQLPTPESRSA